MDPRESIISKRFAGIKKLAVVSSKGGVGKSTLSAILALNFSKKADTGLLDLDAYNPIIPTILGMNTLEVEENKGIVPQRFGDLSVLSFAHFAREKPMPLRGKGLSDAVKEILSAVIWDTEILVIDTPPGMGEITLDLLRLLNNSKFLVVTTPSLLADGALNRELEFLGKDRVIGVVKNMSSERGAFCVRYSDELENAYGNVEALMNSEVAEDLKNVADVLWKRLSE